MERARPRRGLASAAILFLAAAAATAALLLVESRAAFAAWGKVTDLSDTGSIGWTYEAPHPWIATDSLGNTHIVWYSSDGGASVVQYGKVDPTGTPGPTQNLSADDDYSVDPRVATDSQGKAHVVWEGGDGDWGVIRYRRIDSSGVPGDTQSLSAEGLDAAVSDVATDTAGNAHVVWEEWNGRYWAVRYVKIDASGVASPSRILSKEDENACDIHIATDTAGNAHLAWDTRNDTERIVEYGKIEPTGNPASSHDFSQGNEFTCDPHIATDAAGNAHVVWQSGTGWPSAGEKDPAVNYVRIDSDGHPGTALKLSQEGEGASYPEIATDSSGTAHVVWYDPQGVRYRRVNPSGQPGATDTLSADDERPYDPQVATDAAGNAHVVWSTGTGVRYRRVSATGTRGSIEDLADGRETTYYPEVAVDSAGKAHVVWYRSDGWSGIGGENVIQHVKETPGPSVVSSPSITGTPELEGELACSGAKWTSDSPGSLDPSSAVPRHMTAFSARRTA